MNYYSILGINKTASQEEIKKAYRKLAMKNHPDRPDGDAEKFKKINEAYDVLKDPDKRQQYDNPSPKNDFTYNTQNMEDVFNAFFGRRPREIRRNPDLSITVQLTLEEVMSGKDIIGKYYLSDGSEEIAKIRIPSGIESGVTMRFKNLGDNIYNNIPRGDLHVKILVLPHKEFVRDRLHLKTKYSINVFDLLLGKKIEIKNLDGHQISVNIPAGTDPGTILSVPNYGISDSTTGRRGNLYIELKGQTPKIDNIQKEKVRKIYDELSNST